MIPKLLLCLMFYAVHLSDGSAINIYGLNKTRVSAAEKHIGSYYNYYYYDEEQCNLMCESDSRGYLHWELPKFYAWLHRAHAHAPLALCCTNIGSHNRCGLLMCAYESPAMVETYDWDPDCTYDDVANVVRGASHVYYNMTLKIHNNGSFVKCVFEKVHEDMIFITINFIIITHKERLQVSGLDTERQKLELLDNKGLTYNYVYYAGEEINVTCTKTEKRGQLKWQFFGTDPKRNLYFEAQNSSIVYTRTLIPSDDGAIVYCVCVDCIKTNNYFRIFLYLKQSSNGLYLYGVDRNRLVLSSSEEYTYQYYDGEVICLVCQFWDWRPKNTTTIISMSWELYPTKPKGWTRQQDFDLNMYYNDKTNTSYKGTLRAEDNRNVLTCVVLVNGNPYGRSAVSFKLNNTLTEFTKRTTTLKPNVTKTTSTNHVNINITGFDEQRIKDKSNIPLDTYAKYMFNVDEHMNLTCTCNDNTFKLRWETVDNMQPVSKSDNKNSLIYGVFNLSDKDDGRNITCVAEEEVVDEKPKIYKYTIELHANKTPSTAAPVDVHDESDENSESNEEKSEDENDMLTILIVVFVIILFIISSAAILYKCHRKKKPRTPISNDHALHNQHAQIRSNPAYEQSDANKLREDVAYEPCYDQIGEVNRNVGQVPYATMQFGNELYAKPTPKALRQNKKNAVYAQVMPKCERDGAKRNDSANEDGGYYNMFENQPYVNTKTNKEYAEPCYAECSKKEF